MNTEDTICALATGSTGAISIVRVSGERALEIGNRVWHGRNLLGVAEKRKMLLGNLGMDRVLAVYFEHPWSYTGEDVVEFHCHGGMRPARAALDMLLAAGCRMAEPGEFTFRAFVNGKMDLVQAEAVCDLISSHSDMAMKLAEKQLRGDLSEKFAAVRKELTFCLSECESRLDFPEENLDWDNELPEKIAAVADRIGQLAATIHTGSILRDGVRVVIAGKPNAGKSSLLNCLLGYERAIVTEVAGTTRDTLEEMVSLRNIPTWLTDTAGLRESSDRIESMGIGRSRESLARADVVFWMLDASSPDLMLEAAGLCEYAPKHGKVIALWNKCDQLAPDRLLPELPVPTVKISVAKQWNLDQLLDCFEALVWASPGCEEPDVAVNARHLSLLDTAQEALPGALENIGDGAYELAAVRLREAIHALGLITGESADPDILDDIFSRFCIGK